MVISELLEQSSAKMAIYRGRSRRIGAWPGGTPCDIYSAT